MYLNALVDFIDKSRYFTLLLYRRIDKSNTPQKYIVSAPLTDATKKDSIENCYNYYKLQRDTIFHFGDILGPVDNTRFITSKDEANEIINKCIELICTQQ